MNNVIKITAPQVSFNSDEHEKLSRVSVKRALVEVASVLQKQPKNRRTKVLDLALFEYSQQHGEIWHLDPLKWQNALTTATQLLRCEIPSNIATLDDGQINPDYDPNLPLEKGQKAGLLHNSHMKYFIPHQSAGKNPRWHRGITQSTLPAVTPPNGLNAPFALELIAIAEDAGSTANDYTKRLTFQNIMKSKNLAERKLLVDAEIEALQRETTSTGRILVLEADYAEQKLINRSLEQRLNRLEQQKNPRQRAKAKPRKAKSQRSVAA